MIDLNDRQNAIRYFESLRDYHRKSLNGHIICKACKEANVSTWKSRFCPMCGARMDEVKHDE